jgi:hypothetical protein
VFPRVTFQIASTHFGTEAFPPDHQAGLMANLTPKSNGSSSDEISETLTDRIATRVSTARMALESRAQGHRRKLPRRPKTDSADVVGEAEQRETASLKRVFREMGISYRRYRSQTGTPVEPALREAAYRFRAEPSLASLVAVAAYLDELDLLS